MHKALPLLENLLSMAQQSRFKHQASTQAAESCAKALTFTSDAQMVLMKELRSHLPYNYGHDACNQRQYSHCRLHPHVMALSSCLAQTTGRVKQKMADMFCSTLLGEVGEMT